MAARPPTLLPRVGALESWQVVFIAAGAPLMIGRIASPPIGYAWQRLATMFERVWGWSTPQFSQC